MHNLQDKIVIVTGGLGQIGRSLVGGFLAEGARVAVLNRKLPPAADQATLFPDHGDRVTFFEADVTRKDPLLAALAGIETRWGVPDVLINNAGIDSKPYDPVEASGPFETYPVELWEKVLSVNLTGVMLCSQVFGAAMARARKGSIINIGSIYGLVSPQPAVYAYREERDGRPFHKAISYSTSKSGLLNFTRHLAVYWAKSGVRVNLLTYGGIYNETYDEQFKKNFTDRVPMGRQAHLEECVGPALFLASSSSSYMTGANLVVDGGWTAW